MKSGTVFVALVDNGIESAWGRGLAVVGHVAADETPQIRRMCDARHGGV